MLPTPIAPESFQGHQGFVAGSGPELASAFEAALVLATRRFNGAGTDGLISHLLLLIARLAFIDRQFTEAEPEFLI